MKNLLTILVLLVTAFSFSQSNGINGKVTSNDIKVTDLSISVTVDSAEEVKSTFKIEDVKELLAEVGSDENITFEITCNGKAMSNGKKSKFSYKVNGSNKDIDGFLTNVKKMRKAAIEYYNKK
ncbi:hypothetical protein [uncultured Psychroserpens sp.]|uniref:hypothetical protein n=1 Tax=uncultured Psychroserpens sp. TaxID=255436 RepID=UPI00262ECD2E|nr:hypothetical protein [uncultured Psychroserpens sp.]